MPRLLALRSAALTTITAAALVAGGLSATPASAAPAQGTTYRVDCSQQRSGDGRSAPFNSVSAINRHGAFAPGDKVLLKRGTTCKGRIAPQGSGIAAARIVLGAYGKGKRPIVEGRGTPDRTGVVTLVNQQYWTVQDLALTNTSKSKTTSRYRAGVLIRNWHRGVLAGITVQRLDVHSVVSNMSHAKADPREWGGIIAVTDGSGRDGFRDIRILHNSVRQVGRTGISVSNHTYPSGGDRAVQISSNSVSWTRGDGIVLRGSYDARIDHNRVSHASNQWPCPQCGPISPYTANAGLWTAASKRVRIDHNEVWATKALGGDGEGLDIDASAVGTVVEYNYSHDNEGGGLLLCGSRSAIVRFNIFENNKKSAIAFIGSIPARNSAIYNNTIYASSSTRASVVRTFNGNHGSGISFRNNLVYSYGPGKYGWPTNAKTSANTLVGVLGAGRPRDAKTSLRNPGLKRPGTGGVGFKTLSGYKPKHPSSFQRGVAIPKSVTRDFFGKKINSKKPPRGAAG